MDKIYIGIDPGVRTGVAVSLNKKLIAVYTLDIITAQNYVLDTINNYPEADAVVCIENPNLRKWYGKNSNAKIQGAGSIKRDFSIWKQFLIHHAIPYQEIDPKNIKTKLTAESFKNLTKWQVRTSEHSRDAAMMVFGK